MQRFWRFVALIIVIACIGLGQPGAIEAAPPSQAGGDWPLPNGHFFTQAAAEGDEGYAVVDDAEARFWTEFQRLGGLQNVGYPISERFVYDGFVTQSFQKLILQWRPDVGQAWPVNIFDVLAQKGFDGVLVATFQTPWAFQGEVEPPGTPWAEIVRSRQALLDANPSIRTRYFSVPDPLTVFGLPTSEVTDMGNHYAIRTQRAVFQQWKEAVPWAAAGQVTIANGGDIARRLGWPISESHAGPYYLVVEWQNGSSPLRRRARYTIQYSPDEGVTRETRYTNEIGGCYDVFVALRRNPTDPVEYVQLELKCVDNPSDSRGYGWQLLQSTDGARTFQVIAER